MSFEGKYNTKSPAVKRLMREAHELAEATEEYHACPLEDNLFEWHFTVRGPPSSEFDGGIYHGRIILPPEYPMKPPNIVLLTPNGRFEIHKKICLSISGHHPETWQPSWSIRTALLALIAFMPTPGNDTIGSLNYSVEERQKLAKKSQKWECEICGKIINLLREDKFFNSKETDKPILNSPNAFNASNVSRSVNMVPRSSTSHTFNENSIQRLVNSQLLDNYTQENTLNQQENSLSLNNISGTLLIIFLLSVISLLILRRLFFL
ncbi:ubiquitin-conjugating enzyme E2 J1-like [Chelonus insularis]|uniref:ubiquitin-conjugating enzyme E2 J1-like n=1 Tax=Chelonus insularis TaxID=460826 RepID=UPI00158BE1B9|nr:ubiquitin-conjugating enzyme E2 J1-like [Chelonus insularis]XP_034944812.1 ubiquitin-conjugating enzyme E2 J1-like [Chelonus insularis]XP_034944813.1 ubiquitin-conjugating enzyme E2 J1-like [Chelonus insularis]